jgi:Raf kinase inhibitor-like YbhB/YbcL family protein
MSDNDQFVIISTVFSQNGHIPPQYTCEGKNINPPLIVKNIPDGTKTLALIVEDPDASRGVFDHWICWNISPHETIAEGSTPGINGTNSFGKAGYGGPCPPSGEHRYFFKVFALDTELDLRAGSGKKELLDAMKGHVVANTELMGFYQKHKHTVAG